MVANHDELKEIDVDITKTVAKLVAVQADAVAAWRDLDAAQLNRRARHERRPQVLAQAMRLALEHVLHAIVFLFPLWLAVHDRHASGHVGAEQHHVARVARAVEVVDLEVLSSG